MHHIYDCALLSFPMVMNLLVLQTLDCIFIAYFRHMSHSLPVSRPAPVALTSTFARATRPPPPLSRPPATPLYLTPDRGTPPSSQFSSVMAQHHNAAAQHASAVASSVRFHSDNVQQPLQSDVNSGESTPGGKESNEKAINSASEAVPCFSQPQIALSLRETRQVLPTSPVVIEIQEVKHFGNKFGSSEFRNPSPAEVEVIEIIHAHQHSRRVRQWVRDPSGPIRPPKSSHPQSVPDSTPKRDENTKTLSWLAAISDSPAQRSASPTSLLQPPQPREEQAREFAAAWILGDGLERHSSGQGSSPVQFITPPRSAMTQQRFPESNSVRKAMDAAYAKFGSNLAATPATLISPPRGYTSLSKAQPFERLVTHLNRSHSSSNDELPDDGVVTPLPVPVYFAPAQPSPSQHSSVKLYDHRLLPRELSQWATPQPVHVVFDRTP
jgi:hypothetical protein